MQTLLMAYRFKIGGLLLAVILMVIFAASFQDNPRDPQFDQRLFVTRVFDWEQFPPMNYGVSAFLISGIYNRLADPDPITADTNIKIGAMMLYIIGGTLLFTQSEQPKKPLIAVLCLLLMLTTRFPFGWLSTEVLAGGFMLLALWSYDRQFSFALTAFFLLLFGFSKPDLFLPAALVAAYMVYRQYGTWRLRLIYGGMFVIGFLTLWIPSIQTEEYDGNRSLLSLHQHHAVAVAEHQILEPTPDPWAETFRYVPPVWGEHPDTFSAIRANPKTYYDFLWLSVGNSIYNIFASGVWLLIPAWMYTLYMLQSRDLLIITALFFIGIIPITLVAFMHTRYLTRFYPLLLWPIYLYAVRNENINPRRDQILAGYLVVVLLYQLITLLDVVDVGLWIQTTEL